MFPRSLTELRVRALFADELIRSIGALNWAVRAKQQIRAYGECLEQAHRGLGTMPGQP